MKRVILFGASGSIGKQTIELIKNNNKLKLVAVSVYKNDKFLKEIINSFDTIEGVYQLEKSNEINLNNYYYGEDILNLFNIDSGIIVNAVSGFAGLKITLKAIEENKTILLANKESLVCGSKLIDKLLIEHPKSKIYPLDSEHGSLYQLLEKVKIEDVKQLIITASGGPFYGYSDEQLKSVTIKEVLNHPNWNMGSKITIDSASMFNKALEVLEARALYKTDNIKVLIQRKSLIHAILKLKDNSYHFNVSDPDMKKVINYFLNDCSYDDYYGNQDLDFKNNYDFNLIDVDVNKSIPLSLAYDCFNKHNSKSIALNAANEECVKLFLESKIKFYQIQEIVKAIYENCENIDLLTFNDIELFHKKIIIKTSEFVKTLK